MLRRVAAIVVMAGMGMTGEARAEVSCHTINARGVGQDLGGGATEARDQRRRVAQGRTAAQFTITDFSGTVASFAGTVTFTTDLGTLVVTVTGTLDVVSGEFSASGPVTAATGKLEGATGSLSITGVEVSRDRHISKRG